VRFLDTILDIIIEHVAPQLEWRWRKVCPKTKAGVAEHFIKHRLPDLNLLEEPRVDSPKLVVLLEISCRYGLRETKRSLFSRQWTTTAGWNKDLLADCTATDPFEITIEIYEEICRRLANDARQ